MSPTLDTRCDCLGVVVKDEEEQMENDIKIIGNYSPSGHDASRVVDSDGVNISSRMKNQRGNVQKGITQTITTSGGNERGVVLEEKWADLD